MVVRTALVIMATSFRSNSAYLQVLLLTALFLSRDLMMIRTIVPSIIVMMAIIVIVCRYRANIVIMFPIIIY